MRRRLFTSISKGYADAIQSQLRLLPRTERAPLSREAQRAARRDWRVWASNLPGLATMLLSSWFVWNTRMRVHTHLVLETALVVAVPAVGFITTLALESHFMRLARLRSVAKRFPFLCTSCGYNLTGNASGVCPECGTPRGAAAG